MIRALEPYRALDLTTETGNACGKILADLGVDVIKIERPGGDPARNIGPFYGDIPHPERSLFWFTYNTGKRGITLNLESLDGQAILMRLIERADFVIESFPPGYLDGLGIGYSKLRRANTRTIMISITPFGQTGPYKDFKGPELVLWAMSGMMYLTGEPQQRPLRIGVPHLYYRAGTQAAAAGMIALQWRENSGEGQYIDIAIRDSILWSTLHTQQVWDMNKVNLKREGAWRQFGPTRIPTLFPCKDGHVVFRMFGGAAFADGQQALVAWMDSEGMATDRLKTLQWEQLYATKADPALAGELRDTFGKFFLTKTKAELWQEALKRRFPLAPVNTIRELWESPYFVAKDFWTSLEHEDLGAKVPYPGAPIRLGGTPWATRRRAPHVGEHNKEVYENELGLTRADLLTLKQAQVI